MLNYLVAFLLGEFLDKVNGVVGVEQVDESADFLGVHALEELAPVFLVKLHEHVGLLLLIVDEVEDPFGLFQIQALEKLGNVGRVQRVYLLRGFGRIVVVDKLLNALYVLLGKLFHLTVELVSGSRRRRMSAQLSPAVIARSSIQRSPTGLPMKS